MVSPFWLTLSGETDQPASSSLVHNARHRRLTGWNTETPHTLPLRHAPPTPRSHKHQMTPSVISLATTFKLFRLLKQSKIARTRRETVSPQWCFPAALFPFADWYLLTFQVCSQSGRFHTSCQENQGQMLSEVVLLFI